MAYFALSALLLLYLANGYLLLAWSLLTRRWRDGENRGSSQRGNEVITGSGWPLVLTQLPLYNEAPVASRLIDAVAKMDYPKGRHVIQVLDDSSDETCAIVDSRAEFWRGRGVAIEVVRRGRRSGFKAGALQHGMEICPSDLIAIFDADFVPPPDFLKRTVPLLAGDPQAGWVQARWAHVNADANLLTSAQAIAIDAHFGVEQSARSAGLFMAFNGSAGVWRRQAILDAGGWSDETLTEDLDLSCRAVLRGWRGRLLNDLEVPAEIPASAAAYQAQQFRWAKGTLQTAMRMLPGIWQSELPWFVKVQASIQMTQYLLHPMLLVLAVLSPWMAWNSPMEDGHIHGSWQLLVGVGLVSGSYLGGQVILRRSWPTALRRLCALLLAGTSTMLGSTRAALEALSGRRSEFVRTPKGSDARRGFGSAKRVIPPMLDLCFSLYCLGAMGVCAMHGWWAALPMLFFCATGCLVMVFGDALSVIRSVLPANWRLSDTPSKSQEKHGHASA